MEIKVGKRGEGGGEGKGDTLTKPLGLEVIKGHLIVEQLIAPDFNPGLKVKKHYGRSPKAATSKTGWQAKLDRVDHYKEEDFFSPDYLSGSTTSERLFFGPDDLKKL